MEYAGLKFYPDPPVVWLAFACSEHRHQLLAGRPLTAKDRTALAARRERYRRVFEDRKAHEPEQPLATGRAARELADRAKRWEETNRPDL